MTAHAPEALHRTRVLIFAGLTLAVGTPGVLALFDPDLRGYLLHPVLFAILAAPYCLAALLWLPRFLRLTPTSAQVLGALLFLSAAALHVPMLIGMVPMGGDMVGLAFVFIAVGTGLGIVVATVVALGVQWLRHLA